MACYVLGCPGNYNIANISLFVRGGLLTATTIDLMRNARTHRAKEEIALVAMLDLNDRTVTDLKLDCKHTRNAKSSLPNNLPKKI